MSAVTPTPVSDGSPLSQRVRVTVPALHGAKRRGEKVTVLTAYDWAFARLLDQAGVDCLLVGDSLGMVVQGHPHCLTVTMDQMVYHTSLVSRAVRRALVVADMPFMSYQISVEKALQNAGRLIQEGGAAAVKLEGGVVRAETVRAIVGSGIPVMGHIGLTPQSVHEFGGFKVQRDGKRLLADAHALEEAGVFALVIECVPGELARDITAAVRVPTIGIGAGPDCDGQVLVLHDVLGMLPEGRPRFVKSYADLASTVQAAARQYVADVRAGAFPAQEHTVS
jgi:3-methyl-2-oxobutanoate hydroxymethyltransferase